MVRQVRSRHLSGWYYNLMSLHLCEVRSFQVEASICSLSPGGAGNRDYSVINPQSGQRSVNREIDGYQRMLRWRRQIVAGKERSGDGTENTTSSGRNPGHYADSLIPKLDDYSNVNCRRTSSDVHSLV
jgi:hypothetical protein